MAKKKTTDTSNKKKSRLSREISQLTIPKFKDVLINLRTSVIATVVLTVIIFGINTGMQELIRLVLKQKEDQALRLVFVVEKKIKQKKDLQM